MPGCLEVVVDTTEAVIVSTADDDVVSMADTAVSLSLPQQKRGLWQVMPNLLWQHMPQLWLCPDAWRIVVDTTQAACVSIEPGGPVSVRDTVVSFRGSPSLRHSGCLANRVCYDKDRLRSKPRQRCRCIECYDRSIPFHRRHSSLHHSGCLADRVCYHGATCGGKWR